MVKDKLKKSLQKVQQRQKVEGKGKVKKTIFLKAYMGVGGDRAILGAKMSTMEKCFQNYENDFQSKSTFYQNVTKHGGRIKILPEMQGLKIFFESLRKINSLKTRE